MPMLLDPITGQPVPIQPSPMDPALIASALPTLQQPQSAFPSDTDPRFLAALLAKAQGPGPQIPPPGPQGPSAPQGPQVLNGPAAAAPSPLPQGGTPQVAPLFSDTDSPATRAFIQQAIQQSQGKPSLEEQQASLTSDLSRGMGASGQYYYSPRTIAEKQGALAGVNETMRAQAAKAQGDQLLGAVAVDVERQHKAVDENTQTTPTQKAAEHKEIDTRNAEYLRKRGRAPTAPTAAPETKPPPKYTVDETQQRFDTQILKPVSTPTGDQMQRRTPGDFINALAEAHSEQWVKDHLDELQKYMIQPRLGVKGPLLWGQDALNKWMQQTVYPAPDFMKSEDRKGYDLYTKLLTEQGRDLKPESKLLGIPVSRKVGQTLLPVPSAAARTLFPK